MMLLVNVIGELFEKAQNKVLIVAPFIRTEPLARLFDAIGKEVRVTLVSRWRPSDLLAGASDLETFDLAQQRQVTFFLRNDLHAKLFIADDRCLVGSANVTATGLGLRLPSNYELLVNVPRNAPEIIEFERNLLTGAVPATEELKLQLQQLIARLDKESISSEQKMIYQEFMPTVLYPQWVPQIMNPEELYSVYSDDTNLTQNVRIMRRELHLFGLPPGLTERDFTAWIAASISQTPLVSIINSHFKEQGEINESEILQILSKIGIDTTKLSPRNVLQVLERWLTYFLSSDYETARDSIKLIKAKRL